MKRLAIIGSADLGRLIAHHAELDKQFKVTGFFDDYKTKGETVNDIPVLGGVADVLPAFKNRLFDELIIAVGYKHIAFRKKIFDELSQQIPMATVINPSAYIDSSCRIGKGVVILPGCTLDHNVVIGDNVLLNTGCVIAHDSEIRSHSFLSPAVAVAGFVTVGHCCNIGINTTIIDNISITDNTQTGGGTVVIKNIAEAGLYVGNPARFIR